MLPPVLLCAHVKMMESAVTPTRKPRKGKLLSACVLPGMKRTMAQIGPRVSVVKPIAGIRNSASGP